MKQSDPNEKKQRNIGLLIRRAVVFGLPALVIIGALTGNMVMSAFKPTPEEKEDSIKATPVVTARAIAEPVTLSVRAQGEATPLREIDLTPQVTGQIVDVSPAFIEGGAFKKGDTLLKIESAEYNLRVVQARANVAQARSRFVAEEAESNIAKNEWERLGNGKGSELALRKPQLAEAAAALASARAALQEAELNLSRTKIIAPFDGRVQLKNVDVGQYVTPGLPVGRIFSSDVMQIAIPLTNAELGQLGLPIGFREGADNKGPTVTLTAPVAGKLRTWHGRIARTGSGFDRETRVLFAYAEVEDPYNAGADTSDAENIAPLAAGLFVTASIEGQAIENSVIVPRTALRGTDEVFIARDDDTMEIRKVSIASSDRTRAVVISGLEEGESVITSPVRGAADGMAIAIAGKKSDASETIADASTQG